jgi:TonB family protein
MVMSGNGSISGLARGALGLLLLLAPNAFSEDKAALSERLRAADAGTALDSAGSKPWHIKMSVQLFDERGNATDQGTIEEWWDGPGIDRREYKTGTYTSTEIRKDGQLYRSKGANLPPYYLNLLRTQVVHPMPNSSLIEWSTPELRKMNFGKVALECVMLSGPAKHGVFPMGLFPTYCFDPGNVALRANFEFGQQTVLRNVITIFQGKTVAGDVSVRSDKGPVAAAKVMTMEMVPIPQSQFVPDDASMQSGNVVQVGSGIMAGALISRPVPVYPDSAKANHISGTVTLHAIIGADGHINALQLLSTPDADLAISAIASVRKWLYKPYILNGAPTDVDTTITVNFIMGH